MARKSFTLQKLSAEYGSYVQYPSGTGAASVGLTVRTDDDSRLKSDGLLVAPILSTPVRSGSLLPYASFFSAEVSDYEEIILTWDAPLNDLSLAPTNSTVVATALLISYSEDGEPPTVSDGTVITSDATSNIYYHKVPSGKWAYYTMFVKFESRDGDLYYEPTAKLAVLTPAKYNSVDDLYKKIPEYYRNLDDNMSTGLGGPLYRYLSIFGFEIDRVRTALDFMISMKDPQLANSEVLDYLAQDLGVDLRAHELGAARLRNLMNIIGYLRRSEGTIGSLEYAMQAITGSDIEIDVDNYVVKVFAQRVNLLKDPNLERIIAGLFDGGSPSSSAFSLELDAGVPSSSTSATVVSGTFTVGYEGGTPAATGGSTIGNELWNYDPDLVSGGSVNVLQTLSNYIYVIGDDDLYFSVQAGTTSPAQNSIIKVALYKDAPYGNISPAPVLVAQATTATTVAGIKYWRLTVPSTYTSYIPVYFAIFQESDVDAQQHFNSMLLERATNGNYFNGNTSFGGWLVDGNTISDYRWYNPVAPNGASPGLPIENFSVYNSNYQKTRAVASRFLTNLLPVTQLTTGTASVYSNGTVPDPRWTITFNHIPGVTYP
jgi:phage tail-like protein